MNKNEIIDTFNDVEGYEPLALALALAYDQAARGKGLVRHSMGRPFNEQRMMTIARQQGTHKGLEYQVHKKTSEGMDLPSKEARIKEFLGAINYLAGMVLFEMESGGDAKAGKTSKLEQRRLTEITPKFTLDEQQRCGFTHETPTLMTVKAKLVKFYLDNDIPVPPSEHAWYTQDENGDIWGYLCDQAKSTNVRFKKVMNTPLASDWKTSAVTRDELEKALIDAWED